MSETAFPVNDLLRRRLPTGLTLLSLTSCVAATLFLLLFSDQIGAGIIAKAQSTFTTGFLAIFSQFLFFVGILIFAVGAVIVSFIVFLMMAQRTRDFGLMKAAGCPNGLVFGYFFTELLLVTALGCILGIALGFAVDYAAVNTGIFQVSQAPNVWFAPVVFAAFFIFALIFGAKPMLDAARLPSVKAISPIQYFGLGKGSKFKAMSKSQLTIKIASRSLFRRQTATIRIVIFLSVVFILLTVSIAGSIIARDTTSAWVENAIGKDTFLIANSEMATQYTALVTKFAGAQENDAFNYSSPQLAVPDEVLQQLHQMSSIVKVDSRLVWQGTVQEISNFTIDPYTYATLSVGDNRNGESLIVGVDPSNVVSSWYIQGRLFTADSADAVVGDSVGRTLFDEPLSQSFRVGNARFGIVGVCLDPISNGIVVYVPLTKLENITGLSSPNVVFVQSDGSADRAVTLAQLQTKISSINPNLTVVDFNGALEKNINFLGSTWTAVVFLPLFCLAAAAICLVSYLMMSIDEQRQEFAVLRAVGVKPRTILSILGVQSLIVLVSSCAVGVSIGTIVTLLILMSNPIVSTVAVLEIAAWLFLASAGMFLVSLYPAFKFARQPLLRIMS
jgi:ABC-type antimicrobial peptide transport system permease subunit